MKDINLSMRVAVIILAACLLYVLLTRSAYAQSGGGYDLTWNVVAGGASTLSFGGPYTLGATIGQPDAGTLTGGTYTLNGGFWNDLLQIGQQLRQYLPLIER